MNILLVDDEHISNFINKKLIEKINVYLHIIEFNDAREAFGRLSYIKPDLIFLDIHMPAMSGWDFLDKMAAEGIDFKVVILTSSVNTMDRKTAAKYKNVIGYIEKPATILSLASYIIKLPSFIASN
jgi:CheY-like chemotaxis protein